MKKTTEKFAQTSWCIEDIQSVKPEWSTDKCLKFLERHERQIVDDMVGRGWDSINALIDMDEDDEE